MKLGLFSLEQNDFILADGSEVEEFEDLNATLCMMVQIQQIGDDFNNGSIYDSGFINELYDASYLHNSKLRINVCDTAKILEDATNSQLKMKEKLVDPIAIEKKVNFVPINYTKMNELYETFVPQVELSLEQNYFSKASTSKVTPVIENVSNLSSPPLKMPKPSKLQKYFRNLEAEIQISGHEYKKCNKRVLTEEEKKEMNKNDVQNVAKVNDGNKMGEEWQEVKRIVKVGAGTSKNVDGVQVMGDSKNENRTDVGQGKSKSNEGVKQKMKDQNVLNVSNRFNVLAVEIVKEGSDEWIQMKNKINLACDLGMKIADNEKKIWSKDLRKYYDDKCTMKAKANMIEGLNWRITKLQKDIVYGNQNVAIAAQKSADVACKKVMVEQGITQNQAFLMVYDEIYRGELKKIHDWKVDTMIMEQFDKGLKNYMDDEVAEENHRCAKFMTEDIVSNEVESDSAQMQGDGICDSLRQNDVINLIRDNGIHKCGIIETQLRKKYVNNVCDRVFENWDWVSNSVDSRKGCRIVVGWDLVVSVVQLLSQNSQAMHFMVKRINDSEWFYVTFIYAETNVKDRKWLWNNLKEHNVIVNKCPWVLLGDFNVILHLNESTNGLNVKNFGLSEFKECIKELEMEDICSNEVFFTWIQKIRNPDEGVLKKLDRVMGNSHFIAKNFTSYAKFLPYATSDHSPAILVIPEVVVRRCRSFRFMNFLTDKKGFLDAIKDNWNILIKGYAMYVLVKRLKHLKNHIRSLNKENGNVFDKAKVLKDEFTRVQECLDKDHLNASLREEEMVYVVAYKKAALDEEKVLKQKKRIGLLKEEIYPIEDPDCLFIRKLDNEVSVEMIKPVSDDEIKFALFDIDEDKALGPDGQVITNRINIVLNDLVDSNQSAFILGRRISDNIMLTQEFMRGASSSICMNVDNHEFFKAGRGLRQGDPISPYLFTLVMEVLNLMIIRQINDLISASVLRRSLDEFSLCSGMYPSFAKSEAFYGSVPDYIVDKIKMVMLFSEGTLPIRYLGVPMVCKRLGVKDCKALVDIVEKRIRNWKNKELSFAGRLQLIAFILTSLQVYWFSLFILPMTVCKSIDKLLKRFLWARGDAVNGMVSVAWKDVCKPKSQGGLGLKSIQCWNKALMAKHLWNLASRKKSIWVDWINIYRLKGMCIWDEKVYRGYSWSWKQLLDLRDEIKNFVHVKIGSGKQCFIWFDRWNGHDTLGRVINHRALADANSSVKTKVADMIEDNKWKWPLEWDGVYDEVLDVPVSNLIDNLDDKTAWVDKKGKEKVFSVKEVGKAIKDEFPKVIWHDHVWYTQWFPDDSEDVILTVLFHFGLSCKLFLLALFLINLPLRKKAISLNPKLYDASYLHNSKLRIDVCDTEEILKDETNSQLKLKGKLVDPIAIEKKVNFVLINYTKINELYETFVPQVKLSLEQNNFSEASTSKVSSVIKNVIQKEFPEDVQVMINVFYSMESELDEPLKQNELLNDRLLEATLTYDIDKCVLLHSETMNDNSNVDNAKVKSEYKDVQENLIKRI
ncbi:RNA-directed DNA polymerase, eukaryota, reverse transcriptase zinc-binding domain protein [Tanacetum coccineum]